MSDGHDGAVSWQEVRDLACAQLTQIGLDGAELEVRRLIEAATGAEAAEYLLLLADPATSKRLAKFDAMLSRRLEGEPLQYVLGSWGFRTLDLAVDKRVLIPRPETETLVDVALVELARCENAQPIAIDLGTGSGAIGLSLAAENLALEVWLSDVSADALDVARSNLTGLGTLAAPRVRVVEGSWFEAFSAELRGQVDLIASNPPYVTTTEPLAESVRDWEPTGALLAGVDGLDDVRTIVSEAPEWLRPGGSLVVEIDPRQAEQVRDLTLDAGFTESWVELDQYNKLRILVARL